MRLRFAVLLAATVMSAPAIAQVEPLTPNEFGTLFCEATKTGDFGKLTNYVADSLDLEIARAEAESAVQALERPNEKPPLGDGIPWSSFPDAADSCEVIYVNDNAEPVEIAVKHTVGIMAYTDVLLVTGTGADIQVVDVRYDDGHSLLEFLKGVGK